MYAIIAEGATQYRVTAGDTIDIDRHVAEDQKTITFDRVLLVGGEGSPKVGSPMVAGATVTADVLGEAKGRKIDIVKHIRRKGYHKKIGHRQRYTRVRITAINA
jgi:large subunit ribosomal protein L21